MLDIKYFNKEEARRFLAMFPELTIGHEVEQDVELRARKEKERFDSWCQDIIDYINDQLPEFEETEIAYEFESWYGTARVWLSCFFDEDNGAKCIEIWPDLYYQPLNDEDNYDKYHTSLYYEEV